MIRLAVQLDTCRFVGASLSAWAAALTVHLGLAIGCLHAMSLILWFLVPRRLWKRAGICFAIASSTGTLALVLYLREMSSDQKHVEIMDESSRKNTDMKLTWMAAFLASTFGFHSFFKNMAVSCISFPEGADKDLKTWILWYTSLPEPQFVKGNLVKSSATSTLHRVFIMLVKLGIMTVLLSTSPNHKENTVSPFIATTGGNISNSVATIVNSYSQLWWLYLMASFCLDFGSLLVMMQGATTEPPFANPLLQSRSYREAWGERWNRPVHLFLKRSVYKPLRRTGVSPLGATILTFIASGLLHEYNFYCHNYKAYQFGRAMIFFCAMGILMILEEGGNGPNAAVFPSCLQRWVAAIPTPICAILLQSVVVPIFVPLFFQSWVDSGMLASFGDLVPHWECIPT